MHIIDLPGLDRIAVPRAQRTAPANPITMSMKSERGAGFDALESKPPDVFSRCWRTRSSPYHLMLPGFDLRVTASGKVRAAIDETTAHTV